MISIKKYLDERTRPKKAETPNKPLSTVVDTYRSALVAIAKSTSFNGTSYGVELGKRLIELEQRIATKPSDEVIKQTEIEFEAILAIWSKSAEAESSAKDDEIKELVMALARTAETVVAHDHKNASHFGTLTGELERTGNLDDIRQIRNSIVLRVSELRSGIEQMRQESHTLVSELQTKVSTVESRLKSLESLALNDALTGLANRRCLEDRMTYNIEHQIHFCVALFDLNRFKLINDTFGHLAGDDLLGQFGEKLKQKSRATDLIGRWGGDEFLLITLANFENAKFQVQRLQREVSTRYMLHGGDGFLSGMDIEAAAGVAEWEPEESLSQVVAKADVEMYRNKSRMKEARPTKGSVVNIASA